MRSLEIIFIGFLLLVSVAAQAGPCDALEGTFRNVSGSDYSQISIQNQTDNSLVFTLQLRDSKPYNVFYVVDGQEHLGDGSWSGDTYTAFCAGPTLKLIQVFSALIAPLEVQLTVSGDELEMTQSVSTHIKKSQFVRVR